MTLLVKNFIYCNDESLKNSPDSLTAEDLILGNIFDEYTPIMHLAIYAPPGTKFYVNKNDNPVIVGFTGLFDIDLINGGSITSLSFDTKSVNQVKGNDSAMIIIYIEYLGGE